MLASKISMCADDMKNWSNMMFGLVIRELKK